MRVDGGGGYVRMGEGVGGVASARPLPPQAEPSQLRLIQLLEHYTSSPSVVRLTVCVHVCVHVCGAREFSNILAVPAVSWCSDSCSLKDWYEATHYCYH